ncbi:DUF5682 family protein [Glycomyces sp. TRM65418]|uniref:DUF5682 family protein n=1 Tax=Glycomyces sp. TRM65418 TaxID=2867006 RepID=UPI001CE6E582|nr:DUF5682 family protein [Glycomyces sp. TRM65418]MCC3764341.1 DUF5682 family protein [Glycomyces sp. TRM65418]QZD54020.1 hypothetical protein K3N28_14770 [Glycomyces sp. TRM65418]
MTSRLHLQGVRHHSPACARLVAERIERLRPSAVLIEGPADFNDRLDELALAHELPVAIYSYASTDAAVRRSWAPMCDYSPEWVALTEGRKAGAEVRFIDLPAWHESFEGVENRYSDAERRYTDAADRLCRAFAVDNVDALWDHLVEVADPDGLEARLDQYFALLRGEADTGAADTAREAYMTRWIRAALEAHDGPVLVVCGGFHAPALRRMIDAAPEATDAGPPALPEPPEGAEVGTYLVPYSFKRLDAFAGYQSGMPSPEYYQRLWEAGPEEAAAVLVQRITERLRDRGLHVSTSDLIGARSLTEGLARLRGHERPGRTDLLDGLASALISDDLERPLPWARRASLTVGTHPVVVEMTAALTGERVGALHPDTPRPPLVADAEAEMERLGLDVEGPLQLDLTKPVDLQRSRVLHCMRLLGLPGVHRVGGPSAGADVTAEEHWTLRASRDRLPALIEAGALGPTLGDAAQVRLEHRLERSLHDASGALDALAVLLFDAALCGRARLTGRLGQAVESAVDECGGLGAVGAALATVLALWRHDHLFGTAGSDLYAAVVTACASRILWLAEGLHAGPGPADLGRLGAMRALRDAVRHASPLVPPVATVTAAAQRIAVDGQAPPDLRGAALGLVWALGAPADAAAAAEGAAGPDRLGDWLAGLFAVAREEVLAEADDGGVVSAVDGLVAELNEQEFLVALPALRQAFAMFPPRERGLIAERVVALRGGGDARGLTARLRVDPLTVASSMALEARVEAVLAREDLRFGEESR